jgi:acyl-CoA thioester hydrolase
MPQHHLPAKTFSGTVQPEWIDYNGHMSEAFYVLAFGYATDEFYEQLGLGNDFRNQNQCSIYTVEAHINYLAEVSLNEPFEITTQLLEAGTKKLRFCHSMVHSQTQQPLSFTELLVLFVDTQTGKTQPFPEKINTNITLMLEQHKHMDTPDLTQRTVGQR